MGIKDLLKLMTSVTKKIAIKEMKGQKVAIDMMSWIHKGLYVDYRDK